MAPERSTQTTTTIIITNHARIKMNKLKRYEQLIADKLQQLPVPDKEAGWQQMKKLLDDEQPPRNGGGWKWTAILAVIVTIGLWWTVEANKEDKNTIATMPVPSGGNNTSNESTKTLNEDNTTHKKIVPAVDDNNASTSNSNTTVVKAHNNGTVAASNNKADARTPVLQKAITDSHITPEPTLTEAPKSKDGKNNTYTDAGNLSRKKLTEKETTIPVVSVKVDKKRSIYQQLNKANKDVVTEKKLFRRKKLPVTDINNNGNQYTAIRSGKNLPYPAYTNSQEENTFLQKQMELFQNWNERKTTQSSEDSNTQLLLPNANLLSIDWGRIENQLISAAALQKDRIAILKEQEKLAKKTDRRDRLQSGLSNLFKPFSLKADGEPWWAVGLSLNSAVATGSQTRYNYNINAKNNLALDFLPSPYVQFHINDNVYLQTELNLSAPQHTPQIMVSQNGFSMAGSNLQRSVFVQKLYYFNWPVSLHYSPVNNLFLGTGIQFSSLQSGVSLTEDRDINTSRLVNNVVQKFKDDSTAARFKTNEWRWQTGADYYWNRFTLGMRYNQSFSNLLLNKSVSPLSYNNNSFLFFVRYNLFEGRKKESGTYKSTARY
jgi:hypothetical protein